MTVTATPPTRRTIRRYAHEIHPSIVNDDQLRPLDVEVPALYAQAIGLRVDGTGWRDVEPKTLAFARHDQLIDAARTALVADAIHQGLTGDDAWTWAHARLTDDLEAIYDRARHYGVDYYAIKPYPCGPEPDHHPHYGDARDSDGYRTITRAEGREDDCRFCTEPVTVPHPTLDFDL